MKNIFAPIFNALRKKPTDNNFFDAVHKNDIRALKNLVARGYDIHKKFSDGQTLLTSLTCQSEYSAVTTVAFVRFLLENKVDPNVSDGNNYTPLHWAAWNGHLDVVRLLIGHGSNINAQNKYGHTPLMLAAWQIKEEITKMLVDAGALLDIKDEEGKTALSGLTLPVFQAPIIKVLTEAPARQQALVEAEEAEIRNSCKVLHSFRIKPLLHFSAKG